MVRQNLVFMLELLSVFLLVRSFQQLRSFPMTNTVQVSRLLLLSGLADCSGSAWSVVFLALCSSGV